MIRKMWSSFKYLFTMVEINNEIPDHHEICPTCKGTRLEDIFIDCETCDSKGFVKIYT